MQRQVRLVIRGGVQGVGFRYFVRQRALALGVDGEVRNRADGAVELCAAGRREALEELIRMVRDGPRAAIVTDVEIHWQEGKAMESGFWIRG